MTSEHVVLLFTDMVGSTELSTGRPPDEADALRRRHFGLLRRALSTTGGVETKNLGDGVMAVFSSASSALACAVRMQQAVELENRRGGPVIGLRVGLSGGETTREDGDYFGDPVVEASRLCAACQGGQILAAEVVRLMAGRRNRQPCQPVGTLELKGLSEPLETVEVLWEPVLEADAALVPLPGRLLQRPDTGVVGRVLELEALVVATARATEGAGREIVLVSGEAGLGKTTLVAEAARAAFDGGACVLFGHCEEDLAVPYQLFREALGHYVSHAAEDRLVSHVRKHGGALASMVPALVERIADLPASPATDSDSERFLLFAAVVDLLGDLSDQQPVTLVLDDLQWADHGSLLLLSHLMASPRPMRLTVLATYRDDEVSERHPLTSTLAALHRQQRVTRIVLSGMDDAEVLAFMEAGGFRLDEVAVALAEAVRRETDGNPFFVTELLRNLLETGAVRRDKSGRLVAEVIGQVGLPDSLRDVIRARVGRLGGEAADVITMAAVIGRDFGLDVLAAASDRSEDAVLDVLDRAASAALVHELPDRVGFFSFVHALIQYGIYDDLGPTRRARAHLTVGRALERLCGEHPGPRGGELARHWLSAGPSGDPAKAIGYSRLAGDAALASLAPADARSHYEQAMALLEATPGTDALAAIDLAIGLGTAKRQTGDATFRETLIDAAQRAAAIGDTERLVAACMANDRGWASSSGAIDAEKVALLELAADRLPADATERGLVLATLCAELAFGSPLERRLGLADEALRIGRTSGDDATVVRILNHIDLSLLVPPLLEQTLEWSSEALTRAERVGDPLLLYFAALYRATVATRAGMIEEVDRCHEIAAALVQQLNQPPLIWEYTFHLAQRTQVAGDADRVEQLATEALQVGTESGQPDAETFYGVQLCVVYWQRGTMGALIPLIEQMSLHNPGLPTLRAALALAYSEADRLEDAARLLEEFERKDFSLPLDSAWINGMTEYADAAIACGDSRFAEPIFDQLVPWSEQFSSAGGVTAEGPVSLFLGGLARVLGRHEDAERYLEQAARFCERNTAWFFEARTQLAWGSTLAGRGRPGDLAAARQRLERARSLARSRGYAKVESRATQALESLPA